MLEKYICTMYFSFFGPVAQHLAGELDATTSQTQKGLAMRYVLAFILPPFAVLACKKPWQFVVNLIVWLVSLPLILFVGVGLIGWAICTAHALIVCGFKRQETQVNRIVSAIEARNQATAEGVKA